MLGAMKLKIPVKTSLHFHGERQLNNNPPLKVNGIQVRILVEGMIVKMIEKDLEMIEDSEMNVDLTMIGNLETRGDSIVIEDSVMEMEEEAVDLAAEDEITMKVEVVINLGMDLEGVVEEEVVVEETSDPKTIIIIVRVDKIEIEASTLEINLATHHSVEEEVGNLNRPTPILTKIRDLIGEICQVIMNNSILQDGALKNNKNKLIKHLYGAIIAN